MIDIFIIFLSIFLLFFGAARGFMHSLFVPFSLLVATLMSVLYFQITKDWIFATIIGLIGPFLINLSLKMVLKIISTAVNQDIKPSILSRLSGALITLTWGWVFITLTLFLFSVMPPIGKGLKTLHEETLKSISFMITKPLRDHFLGFQTQPTQSTTRQADIESLAADPRFKAINTDADIQKAIQAHDMMTLMKNPKIQDLTQQIMSDPVLLKKVMAVYQTQAKILETPSTS